MHSSPPQAPVREQIGRYEVLRKIATGGMAELFLAKQVGLDGFEKVVAIKRILAHLAHDDDFVQMFQDEARIVAKLHHPNIVQIFDLGKADDTYFIAMEYIPGRNLSSVAKKSRAKNEGLPPGHIAHCMAQACEGLYYAHTRHDIGGRPLDIVHRDVSPQNIIVAFSGSVKLVDFGIAKAATKIAHTRAGVLKGKYAYMSPEQIRGERTDARSDLFAVGIVLYELLCGRRPFEKDNSIQTLKSIVQDDPAPCQSLNPRIPDPLAAIIDRCLEKEPTERYQTAQEIQLALEDFVSTCPTRINNLAVSQWVTALFEEDLVHGQGGTVHLPGVGEVVLPEPQGAARKPERAERPPANPSALIDLSLSRGRGGGSIPAPPMAAPSTEHSEARPNGGAAPVDGRSDLLVEGVIERRGAEPALWDQAPTVHFGAQSPLAEPVDAANAQTRPRQAAYGGDEVMPAIQEDLEPLGPVESLDAPLSNDAFVEIVEAPNERPGEENPWEEATVGLPEAAKEDPPGPSTGRARRLAQSTLAPRQARQATLAPSPMLTGSATDEPSDPSSEIWAAMEKSGGFVDDDQSDWSPFEGIDDSATIGLDDPWGEQTVADPGLYPEEADEGAVVHRFDEESIEGFDLNEDSGARAGDDATAAHALIEDDATVAQAALRDDPTIDQAALDGASDDATIDPSTAMGMLDGSTAVEPTEAPTGFSDDQTVAYSDEFVVFRQTRGVDHRVVDDAPTAGLDDELSDVDAPDLGATNEFATVRNMAEEPARPSLGTGARDDDLDGKTIAAADLVLPQAEDETQLPVMPAPETGVGLAEEPPAARAEVIAYRPRTAGGAGRRPEAETELQDSGAEEVTLGVVQAAAPPVDDEDVDDIFDLEFDDADPVQPKPLDAPPGEEDQISYQEEYSALVAPPEPLSGPHSGLGAAPIGSTNVPPVSLSLSQVLAHPAQAPRSRLAATPRSNPQVEPLRPSVRTASMVGRQIREVVRTSDASHPPLVRADTPKLDLVGALGEEDVPDEILVRPQGQRRWLAPVLAMMSVVLFAVALYLAQPYLFGPSAPHLELKTTPPGARVFIDGLPQEGQTPLTISGLAPGVTYRVRLERKGYDIVEREVQLPKEGPLVWQIPMSRSRQK